MTSKRLDFYKKLLLKTPSHIRRTRPSLLDYSPELRGPPNNRYGGHQTRHLRGLKGGTYGPASPVRQYTREEIKKWEQDRRE
jgi:hypothetical protein